MAIKKKIMGDLFNILCLDNIYRYAIGRELLDIEAVYHKGNKTA